MARGRVTACLVTRGDVDMTPIYEALQGVDCIDEIVLWDNAVEQDQAVYGRYAAVERANNDLIFTQDDDCIVAPHSIESMRLLRGPGRIICNMPARFRHSFYREHALVGFGAIFYRDLVQRAFTRFWDVYEDRREEIMRGGWFARTSDIIFTGLTPYTMVDLPYENLGWASAPNRMYMQSGHVQERQRMLDLVREISP